MRDTNLTPYDDRDAADVAALLAAVPELPSTTVDSFRAFAALSFNRGACDFVVVRRGSQLVALLTSTLIDGVEPCVRHFRIAVHPEHRRQRLGTRLLETVERQAAPPPARSFSATRMRAGARRRRS